MWSNIRFVGETVKTLFGRELAWQSTQEAGCGRSAFVKDAWKRAGVIPAWSVAQVADMLFEGAT